MKRSPIASTFLTGLSCLLPGPVTPVLELQEIPLYEPIPIAQLIHAPQPAAGISVVATLAESGHPRGHWEGDRYHAISKERAHE